MMAFRKRNQFMLSILLLVILFYALHQNYFHSKQHKAFKLQLMTEQKHLVKLKLRKEIKSIRHRVFVDSSQNEMYHLYQSNKPANDQAKTYIKGERKRVPNNGKKFFTILEYTRIFTATKVTHFFLLSCS